MLGTSLVSVRLQGTALGACCTSARGLQFLKLQSGDHAIQRVPFCLAVDCVTVFSRSLNRTAPCAPNVTYHIRNDGCNVGSPAYVVPRTLTVLCGGLRHCSRCVQPSIQRAVKHRALKT